MPQNNRRRGRGGSGHRKHNSRGSKRDRFFIEEKRLQPSNNRNHRSSRSSWGFDVCSQPSGSTLKSKRSRKQSSRRPYTAGRRGIPSLHRSKGNKGRRKSEKGKAILPNLRKCTEDLSSITTQDVLVKLSLVLNPATSHDDRLNASAWLEKAQGIERGFILAMECLELSTQGKLPNWQGVQFAVQTLKIQCDGVLEQSILIQQQHEIITRMIRYLQFFMLKQQKNIAFSLARAMIAVFYRSTIKVMDQISLLGGLLDRAKQCDNINNIRAMNETVAICLCLVPEVSQSKDIKGIDKHSRTRFNVEWKKQSNQIIELLANMIREHPQLQEIGLNCVAMWLDWSRVISTSDSLTWLVQSSFQYFLADPSVFSEDTLYAAREVICKYIVLKATKKDRNALAIVLSQIVMLDQDIVLSDLECRSQSLAMIIHEFTTRARITMSNLFEKNEKYMNLLFKFTNCKDSRVVYWTLECWNVLCRQGGIIKKDAKGVQPLVVQRAIIAIVLSCTFPENWEEEDDDIRTDFYMHRQTVTDCIKNLVKRADLQWFVTLCKTDLESGTNWRTIEGGLYGLLAVSKHLNTNTQLSIFLLDLCMQVAKTEKCHKRLATTICMLLSTMSAFVCENLGEGQLEVVVNFLNACLNLSQFDEVWPCSENEEHPSVSALCSMMITSPESMRGNILKLIIQAYYQVEFRDVIKDKGLISSKGRLQLSKCIVKNILKLVKPQDTGPWMSMMQLIWDLFLAATQKGQTELSHAAQVAMFLYKDSDRVTRSDSQIKQKAMMALKQLGAVLETNWEFIMNLIRKAPKEDPAADISINNTPPILQSVCEMIRYGIGRVQSESTVVKMAEDLANSFEVRPESYLLRPFEGMLIFHSKNPAILRICSIVVLRYLEAINKVSLENMPNPECTMQIFTLVRSFINSLPDELKVQCLSLEGTPNFLLLLCGVMARMTHLKDFFMDPSHLLPVLNFFPVIVKTIERLTQSQKLHPDNGDFVFACLGNLLLCLAFWGVSQPLVEKIALVLTSLKKLLKHSRRFKLGRLIKSAFNPTLFERFSLPNLINPPLCGSHFRLNESQQKEVIIEILGASTDQRLRVVLQKYRNIFPTS